MVHDISDILGNGTKMLVHRNSTTGAVRLHASFGPPSTKLRTRQCTDFPHFCVDNDDGYASVFFDANSTEWAGADRMTDDQVDGISNKTIDYMTTNNFDSACLGFVDTNGGDTAASLWLTPSNEASFHTTENGCPNI